MPAFYNRPTTIEELIRQSAGRALDILGVDHEEIERWTGPN
jgi:4-hydroxy-3-polyprenylbenzoate decarboxylase